jgi:predicted MFS family arabinose efflux permease
MGYIEIAVGLGLGLGPTVGSFVFNFLRYEYTLYFFALCSFLALLMNTCLIPKAVDKE